MTDHITSRLGRLHRAIGADASEIGNWSARCNLANQEALLVSIAAQAEQPIEVVAERLEISVEEVRDALSGRVDLTMTEMRLLSIASDLIVTYQVRSARRDYRGWLRGMDRWHHEDSAVSVHRGHGHDELDPSEYGRRALEATG